MEFSDIILDYFSNHNITPAEISKNTGIDKSTFTKWKKKSTSKIELSNVVKISKYLGISIEELLSLSTENVEQNQPTQIEEQYNMLDEYGREVIDNLMALEYKRCLQQKDKMYPITDTVSEPPMIKLKHSFYKVSAGKGFSLGDGDAWQDEIEIPDTTSNRKADFCITIKGNSMEPLFKDNDTVLVKSQDSVEPGQIGIFNVGGEGFIKKFGGDRLISLNEEYDDILFSEHQYENIKCVGIVLGRI